MIMTEQPMTTMAISAHHNRIGFCFLIGKQPMDWQLARNASKSPERTKAKVMEWLRFYRPNIVVTEDLTGSVRKGKQAQRLILAAKEAALETDAQHIEIGRTQPFGNKYEQIDRLCDEFPQLKVIQPKQHRRIFDCEPAHTTVFEACSMALDVLR